MPGTLVTASPLCGETQLVPWVSGRRSGRGGAPPPSPPPPELPSLAAPGVGVPAVKSVALSSLSGALERATDWVLEAPVAGAVSLIAAVPYPTRSVEAASHEAESVQVRASVPWTRATLPDVADIAMVPLACVAGRGWVPP